MTDRPLGQLNAHPLRAQVLEEIHARPFAAIASPCRVLHFAFLGGDGPAERAALCAWLRRTAAASSWPAEDARHFQTRVDGRIFQWERHGEFTAYTFETEPGAPAAWPDELPQPGPLLVAVRLDLGPPAGLEATARGEMIRTQVADGRAVAGSSFRADADGMIEIAVEDLGLGEGQAGPLVQRILEVETYRTLALLGLPEAQRQAPTVQRIETELPQIFEAIRSTSALEESRRLLDEISALTAELEAGSAAAAFRFGATRAYAELMRLRLESLHEAPLEGAAGWAAFFARRLNPALRTCAAVEERQASLSRKLTRAANLLRTQVDVALQYQNRELLAAMNRRARLQLRLQQTVEGLSVAAISYYVASLAHLGLEGLHRAWPRVDPTLGAAAAVPVIIVLVWWTVARIRRSHRDD